MDPHPPDPHEFNQPQPGQSGPIPWQPSGPQPGGPPVPYGQQPPMPYGPMPYGQPAYQQPIYVRPVPSSGTATASLVVALIGVFGGWCLFGLPCLIAVVLGHIGLSETRKDQKSGKGQAIAGLILGYLFLIPMVLISFAVVGGMVSGGD